MIVMKFGGTSVEDAPAIERVAAIVRSRAAEDPVVVVSAMARVTDQLLAAGQAAAAGDRELALESAPCDSDTIAPLPNCFPAIILIFPSFSRFWNQISISSKNC
jgi:aspartokinase